MHGCLTSFHRPQLLPGGAHRSACWWCHQNPRCAEFWTVGPGCTGPCVNSETSHEVMSIGPVDRLQHFVLFSVHQICNELTRCYFKGVN